MVGKDESHHTTCREGVSSEIKTRNFQVLNIQAKLP